MSDSRLLPLSDIRSVALVGAGSVGKGWAALLVAKGYDVAIHDPAADPAQVKGFVEKAWPALRRLGIAGGDRPDLERLRFCADLAGALEGADLVFENGPELVEVKQALIARIDAILSPDRLILSSSGGIRPTLLQQLAAHPGRVLVAHPFNPPHLVPLVEIVGGQATASEATALARDFIAGLGKRPILLKREMVGHLANRIQAAVLRETFHCVLEDVASPQDIDDALRFGLGVRWALMGGIMTFDLAGGPGGAAHTLDMARKAYADWWADLGEVTLTPEVEARLIAAAKEVEQGKPTQDWIAWRDEGLVDIIALQNERINKA